MSTLNVTNLKNEASASNNVTLDSNGRVGVGIAPNTSLHVKGNITVENTTNAPFISFVESGDNTDEKARIEMDQISGTAGQLIFYTENGGTIGERLRIQSAGGISFNGDTAAANALDDYEEGTWTPTWGSNGSSPTAVTYTARDGYYTKIGRTVTITCYLLISSWTTGTGSFVTIGNLPFSINSNQGTGSCRLEAITYSGSPFIQQRATPGVELVIGESLSAAGSTFVAPGDIANNAYIVFTYVYQTL